MEQPIFQATLNKKININPRHMLWEFQTLVASLNGIYIGNVRARIPILEMMQQPTGNWVRSYEQTKMDNYIWRGNYLCFNLHLSLQHHPFLNFLSRLCHIIVTRSHSSPVCKGNSENGSRHKKKTVVNEYFLLLLIFVTDVFYYLCGLATSLIVVSILIVCRYW